MRYNEEENYYQSEKYSVNHMGQSKCVRRVKNEVTIILHCKSTNANDVTSLMTETAELRIVGRLWINSPPWLHYKVMFSSVTPGAVISFQSISLLFKFIQAVLILKFVMTERRSVKMSSDGVNPVEWKPYALRSVTSLIRSQSKDVRAIQGCNCGGSLKKHYFLVNGFGKLHWRHTQASVKLSRWTINFNLSVWPTEKCFVSIFLPFFPLFFRGLRNS